MTRLFSLIALLGCLMQAVAQPYFPCTPRLDNPYGVCTHITRPGWDYEIRDNELDVTRNAGIGWVRSDLDFGNFFTSYTTANPDLFRNVLNSTDHYGTNLLGILTRMGKQSWDDPQYARLVEMMAKTYDGRITHWEAQNEVNLIRGVDDLCRKYVGVLKTTYETLKKVNPKNVVLTSGFGELHEPFLSDFSRLGGWKYCDVFNFHTYFTPEGLIPCFERLKETMNRDGWERPVWLTECGMHTANDRQNSAGFLSDLLPAALRRIGKEPRKTAVGVLRDAESGYNVLTDDDADYLLRPHFRRVAFISLQQLQGLSVKDVPVLVAAADEYFPGTRFPALLDYVRRGGTIVLAGGMPFYYDAHTPDGIFLNRKELGTSLYRQLHMAPATRWEDPASREPLTEVPPLCERNTDIAFSYGWTPTKDSPARYLSDANLHPGDSLIPLISAGTAHLRYPIAGIYRLNSELKGNIIFQTRMYAKISSNKEAEQARRVPRLYLIAFSYGVDKVFWYNLRSREKDPAYSEDNFGLLHSDLSDKPAMKAYRTLTEMCPDGSTRPTLTVTDGLYHTTWSRPDGTAVHALWAPTGNKTVRIKKHSRIKVYDHLGNRQHLKGKTLDVKEGVYYVEGDLTFTLFPR